MVERKVGEASDVVDEALEAGGDRQLPRVVGGLSLRSSRVSEDRPHTGGRGDRKSHC